MNQPAELTWREGRVPVSQRFDDPYFSLENGLEETAYVFLDGNDLPGRFRDGFHIAELGFGTGLNLLAALALWRNTGQSGKLHFTSFEAFPMAAADMLAAQAAFPALADLSGELALSGRPAQPVLEPMISALRSCLAMRAKQSLTWPKKPMPGFSTVSPPPRIPSFGSLRSWRKSALKPRPKAQRQPIPPQALCAGPWPKRASRSPAAQALGANAT